MPDPTPQSQERSREIAGPCKPPCDLDVGPCDPCSLKAAIDHALVEQREPKAREYVIVPMGWDEGEIEGSDGPIEVQLVDLDDEITIVGAPRDIDRDNLQRLSDIFSKQEPPGKRQFIVAVGGIPVDWQFVKLVPRDQYDPVLRERRLGT